MDGYRVEWLPPYMLTTPPLSNTPVLVWMSIMPAVRSAIFGGQGAGDQPHGIGQTGIEGLAEHRNAFRQDDAVQPVLQAVMLAAHMQLAETVLGHARHAAAPRN